MLRPFWRPVTRFTVCTRGLCSGGAEAGFARKELATLLCTGGDSRLHLTELGTNKYFCAPEPASGPVLRSSCTCSPPSALGFSHALDKWHALEATRSGGAASFESAFSEAMASVRQRLSRALNLPDGTAVVLSASGTDAEYVPLAIARELSLIEQHAAGAGAFLDPAYHAPCGLHSVLVAAEEVGSGCKEACAGEHFDQFAPFAPMSETVSRGQRLEGFEDVVMHTVPARHEDGSVVDASVAIGALVEQHKAGAPWWVVRLVDGTKTAFTTTLPAAAALPARSITVVDGCQTRLQPSAVRAHLDAGRLLLVTGSKFMQGAAFSGAVLVPAPLARRLRDGAGVASSLPRGMGDYFSRHEMPAELAHWAAQLHSQRNEGLLSRWHTALPHLEAVGAIDEPRRRRLETAWTDEVLACVARHPALSVAAVEKGIVSIRCANRHRQALTGKRYHGAATLKSVYRWLTSDMSLAPGADSCAAAGTVVYLGQPVSLTKDEAVLRIAMGAELLLQMNGGTYDAATETVPVEKLAWAVDNFARIAAWEAGASSAASEAAASRASLDPEAPSKPQRRSSMRSA